MAAESCNASYNGLADCTTVADLNRFGYAEDPDVDLDYTVVANSYTISGQHVLGGDRFSVTLGGRIIRSDRLP